MPRRQRRYLVGEPPRAAFRAIAPSGFGYFGSTLPEGATAADQADADALLLDRLGVDRRRARVLGGERVGPRVRAAPSPARDRADPRLLPPWWRGHLRHGVRTPVPPRLQRGPPLLGLQEADADGVLDDDDDDEEEEDPQGLSAVTAGGGGNRRGHGACSSRLSPPRWYRLGRVRLEPACGPVPFEQVAVPTLMISARDDPLAPLSVRRHGGTAYPGSHARERRGRWPRRGSKRRSARSSKR
jgi:hypothetical protein